MPHTITYDVDEPMNRTSISQYLWTVHLKPKIPVFVILPVLLIALLCFDFTYRNWLAAVLGTAIGFLIIAWVKTYVHMQAQGRDGLKLLSHPTITITLTDDTIEYASSTGTRRHDWSKIDRFCETKDFLVFQSGKVPLLILPKAPLTADARAFIQNKPHSLKPPATR